MQKINLKWPVPNKGIHTTFNKIKSFFLRVVSKKTNPHEFNTPEEVQRNARFKMIAVLEWEKAIFEIKNEKELMEIEFGTQEENENEYSDLETIKESSNFEDVMELAVEHNVVDYAGWLIPVVNYTSVDRRKNEIVFVLSEFEKFDEHLEDIQIYEDLELGCMELLDFSIDSSLEMTCFIIFCLDQFQSLVMDKNRTPTKKKGPLKILFQQFFTRFLQEQDESYDISGIFLEEGEFGTKYQADDELGERDPEDSIFDEVLLVELGRSYAETAHV